MNSGIVDCYRAECWLFTEVTEDIAVSVFEMSKLCSI